MLFNPIARVEVEQLLHEVIGVSLPSRRGQLLPVLVDEDFGFSQPLIVTCILANDSLAGLLSFYPQRAKGKL